MDLTDSITYFGSASGALIVIEIATPDLCIGMPS
jgi:hypothetical protein